MVYIRTEDEEREDVKPDRVVDNLAAAVDYILSTTLSMN